MRVTFCDGLKPSKRQEFSFLPQKIQACFEKVQRHFPTLTRMEVCVDESVVKRTEYTLEGIVSNRALAYLGDAYLSLFLARSAYERGYDANAFQQWRTSHTSDKHLSVIFDELFKDDEVVQVFGTGVSVGQKATFMEALVGALDDGEERNKLMRRILK